MAIPVSERYHAVVLQPKGEFFGSVQGPDFRATIDDLLAGGKSRVVLDFSRTTLMDSSGIGVLIEGANRLRAEGGDLRVAALESRMRNLFLMTRLLGDVFQVFETVDEAVDSFAPSGAASGSEA